MTRPGARKAVTVDDEKLAKRCARGRVVVIDDDPEILAALSALLELEGYACETYVSALAYLQVLNYNRPCFPGPACILSDVKMPELDGLELQSRLAGLDAAPLVLMSGASGALEAVSAFHGGALDFLIKPIDADVLLEAVAKALAQSREAQIQQRRRTDLAQRIATLTERERTIARRVAQGQINRAIADDLGIALRTVKLHRQRAMEKLGAHSVVELARIADAGGL
jgi:two-component system, LuxR family, response regulator FixJ